MTLPSVWLAAGPLLAASAGVPAHFRANFRCPFAHVWVEHGAEKAAEILGVTPHRRLLDSNSNFGSCMFSHNFAGDMCMELRTEEWTQASAKAKCDAPTMGSPGTLTTGGQCDVSGSFAGWCSTEAGKIYTPSFLGGMTADCQTAASSCTQWGGTFVQAGDCAPSSAFGSCEYRHQFAGDMCMELRTADWTQQSAKAKCDAPPMGSAGILTAGGKCDTSDSFAGWCSTEAGVIYTPSFLGGMTTDCDAAASGCTQWGGTYVPAGECASQEDSNEPQLCTLAPGAMGAAHMLGSSPGYKTECEGSPAEGSPYMWPLRWEADVESRGLSFGSDAIQYTSRGKVMYMTDKNWKRIDNYFQDGVMRTIGQGPCETAEAGNPMGCERTTDKHTTILHRGSRMSFIEYDENGDISKCEWMDLGPIGNVRPDWYMDDRGDSTDVQYIGDSHVYYLGMPRLVKQWRKKDFANQYFTMSMQAIPGEDNIHWPLILNVPGEGFGDDFLQHYSNHRIVTDNDEAAFLIDETVDCPKMESEGSGGPPVGEQEHVPSNLEVQKESWRTILWTGSPVWVPPPEAASAASGMQEVTKAVSVAACFDDASLELRFVSKMKLSSEVWAGIAWRSEDFCIMSPADGSDTEMVFAKPEGGSYSLHLGKLNKGMKQMSPQGLEDGFAAGLKPLSEVSATFGKHQASLQNGELTMKFERTYASRPTQVSMNFAFGDKAEVGYHASRGCFELESLPTCAPGEFPAVAAEPGAGCPEQQSDSSGSTVDEDTNGGRRLASGGAAMAALGLGAFLQ